MPTDKIDLKTSPSYKTIQSEENTSSDLSYKKIYKEIIIFVPSGITKSARVLGDVFTFSKLGRNASSNLITSFNVVLEDVFKAFLHSSGLIISKQYTDCKEIENLEISIEHKKAIGSNYRKSLIIATGLSAISAACMLSISSLFKALNIDEEIVTDVDGYMKAAAIGIAPTLWSQCNKQLLLSVSERKLPITFNVLSSALSWPLGYIMATGLIGYEFGVPGIGYANSICAWLLYLPLQLYILLSKKFKEYHLTDMSLVNATTFKEFCKIGVPLGLANLSESSNIAINSALIDKMGAKESFASSVSVQAVVAATEVIEHISEGVTFMISESYARLLQAIEINDTNEIQNCYAVLKRISRAGCSVSLANAMLVAGTVIALQKQLSDLFSDAKEEKSEGIENLSFLMTITNSFSILIDAIRDPLIGCLNGIDDVVMAPLMNFLCTTIAAVSIAAACTYAGGADANTFFIARTLMMFLTTIFIANRWVDKSTPQKELSTEKNSESCCKSVYNFFNKNSNTQKITDELENGCYQQDEPSSTELSTEVYRYGP